MSHCFLLVYAYPCLPFRVLWMRCLRIVNLRPILFYFCHIFVAVFFCCTHLYMCLGGLSFLLPFFLQNCAFVLVDCGVFVHCFVHSFVRFFRFSFISFCIVLRRYGRQNVKGVFTENLHYNANLYVPQPQVHLSLISDHPFPLF